MEPLIREALRARELHETVRRLRALGRALGVHVRVGAFDRGIRIERFGVTIWLQRCDGDPPWRAENASPGTTVVVLRLLLRP